jgi:hypothetical protein
MKEQDPAESGVEEAPAPTPVERLFVESLPDLISASEYADHPHGDLVRLRVVVTDDGVEVLSDAMRPVSLEALLSALGGGPTEQMLCG